MGLGGGACACRQDEFLQARQLRVVVRQRLVELQQGAVLQQRKARHGELAAEVEELVLDVDQQLAHLGRQWFAQQQAEVRVELVHVAHGVRAAAVFGYPGVVAQAGAAVVAGAGGNLREAITHEKLLMHGGIALRHWTQPGVNPRIAPMPHVGAP